MESDRQRHRNALRKGSTLSLMAGIGLAMGDSKGDEYFVDGVDPTLPPFRPIPVEKLVPNPDQPRKLFPKEELEELATSIRAKGMLNPIVARDRGNDVFEIVAGERRWRAAQLARLDMLPTVIMDLSDAEVLEVGLIENVQRKDLNPIEEALGYRVLIETYGHSQSDIARGIGKTPGHVSNLLRLLALPKDVLGMLRDGRLTAGHGRALLGAPDPSELAAQAIARGMTVRGLERHVRLGRETGPKRIEPLRRRPELAGRERRLSEALGMEVEIRTTRDFESGTVTIKCRNEQDFEKCLGLLDKSSARRMN